MLYEKIRQIRLQRFVHTLLGNRKLVENSNLNVAEGIIDQLNEGYYPMVVIGRKRLSKDKEFVRSDVSVKLIRALTGRLCWLLQLSNLEHYLVSLSLWVVSAEVR